MFIFLLLLHNPEPSTLCEWEKGNMPAPPGLTIDILEMYKSWTVQLSPCHQLSLLKQLDLAMKGNNFP